MQTFLPYPSFSQSAECLDRSRLGKQRVECLQLLNVLLGKSKVNKNGKRGWENHPATLMWKGHERALVDYAVQMCDEWIRRGYKDTCRDKITSSVDTTKPVVYPSWVGDMAFHVAHRSNLIRKMPEHYQKLWPTVTGDLPYVWPASRASAPKEDVDQDFFRLSFGNRT